jgi:phosphotransferase system HPr-like phosphotransfer protein
MDAYTLVSKLTIKTPISLTNLTDVSTTVGHSLRRPQAAVITFGVARGHTVTVTLTGAERIALIEALGGTA